MKTRNIFVSIMLALMIVLSLQPVSAVPNSAAPQIAATLLSQEPDPVQPGRYVELRFRVENLGTTQTDNLIFELLPDYPFSFDPGDNGQVKVGSFYGKATGNNSATLYYKLRVDPNAIEGSNTLRLRYTSDNGQSWTINEFPIRVQTVASQIGITSVTTIPDRLEPGKVTRVVLTMSNLGDSFIQDVTIGMDLSAATLPFAPINSTTEKTIKIIGAKSSVDFPFDIITLGNAGSSIYKVPIEITYSDSAGDPHTKSDYISLIVGTSPDIEVLLDSQSFYTSGTAGTLTIKFVNKGVTGAKFMNVKVEPTDKFELLSSDTVYIGNVDSDDFQTADYKVYVKPTADKTISVPIVLDYTDANNQAYHQRVNIPLRLYSGSELKMFGMARGGGLTLVIIVLVLAGAGYLIYRRFKKAKTGKK